MNELNLYQFYLNKYLSEIPSIQDPIERMITQKAINTINTPVYSVIAKINGASDDQIQRIYKAIRTQAVQVLYLDKFYETGDKKYMEYALQAKSQLEELLPEEFIPVHRRLQDKLGSFFDLEKKMADLLYTTTTTSTKDSTVSLAELESFTVKKSTDTFLYEHILHAFVTIRENVLNGLFAAQLARDVTDDWEDLQEDLQERMPNPILCRLRTSKYYQESKSIFAENIDKMNQKQLEQLVTESGALEEHRQFIKNFTHKLVIRLHPKYQWLMNDVITKSRDYQLQISSE